MSPWRRGGRARGSVSEQTLSDVAGNLQLVFLERLDGDGGRTARAVACLAERFPLIVDRPHDAVVFRVPGAENAKMARLAIARALDQTEPDWRGYLGWPRSGEEGDF